MIEREQNCCLVGWKLFTSRYYESQGPTPTFFSSFEDLLRGVFQSILVLNSLHIDTEH